MNVSGSKVLLRSLLASYLLSGVLLLILSFALYRLKLGEEQVNAAVYGVYCLPVRRLSGRQSRLVPQIFLGNAHRHFVLCHTVCYFLADEPGNHASARSHSGSHRAGLLRCRRNRRRDVQLNIPPCFPVLIHLSSGCLTLRLIRFCFPQILFPVFVVCLPCFPLLIA